MIPQIKELRIEFPRDRPPLPGNGKETNDDPTNALYRFRSSPGYGSYSARGTVLGPCGQGL
jgi:hypothetical protein